VGLLPEIRDELWNEQEWRNQQIPVADIGQFSFSVFSTCLYVRAEASFTEEAKKLNDELPAHLTNPLKELQLKVSNKIEELEASKEGEFWHSEAKRLDADMEARSAEKAAAMNVELVRAQKSLERQFEQERQATAAAHARERLASQQRQAAAAEEQRKLAAQLRIDAENRVRAQQEFGAGKGQLEEAAAQARRDFEREMNRIRSDFDEALNDRSNGHGG
jgi:hypothetical protein